MLEIGTGLGYTAALMATASGSHCRVDTIESDREHVEIAVSEFGNRGLDDQVTVFHGDCRDVLSELSAAQYDIVFSDGGSPVVNEIGRVVAENGFVIDKQAFEHEIALLVNWLTGCSASSAEGALIEGRERYRAAVQRSLGVALA